MAALPGDYEDGGEEEFTLPLPPEDRLWRHPSELGGESVTLRIDPTMVRNRWLSSQPSRASAWTAGLVGALLASGLVVLGTHLATSLTGAPTGAVKAAARPATPTLDTAALSTGAFATALSASIASSIATVGRAVVRIDAAFPHQQDAQQLGVLIAADGTVLTAADTVAGATSVLIELPSGADVPAVAIEPDAKSGLAVLRVNGAAGLPVTTLAAQSTGPSSFVVAVTAPGGATDALGDVHAPDASPAFGSGRLVDAMVTDLPATTPAGSPVLDADGAVVGIVAGTNAQGTAVVPAWLALPVANELMTNGAVAHGWLGIHGEDNAGVAGAVVESVTPKTAGAEAGIRAGDVITSLDGKRVRSMAALSGRLYALRPGAAAVVAFTRGGSSFTRRIRLDDKAAA